MNRTASINLKGINVTFFRDNLITIVLLVLTVFSMLCGTLSLRNEAVATFAESRFADFIASRGEARFINAFLTALIESVKLPIISFLCGTSVLGTIISPLVLFYCAFSYGCLSGYVYSLYGLSGIVFNLFVLLLPSLILLFVLLISAGECVDFSKRIASLCIRQTRPVNLYSNFHTFCVRHLVLLIPTLLSALSDVALFNIFEKYFKF